MAPELAVTDLNAAVVSSVSERSRSVIAIAPEATSWSALTEASSVTAPRTVVAVICGRSLVPVTVMETVLVPVTRASEAVSVYVKTNCSPFVR